MTYGPKRGPTRLDDGATRASIAADCREAALGFMSGTSTGWDKLDLVLWLTGPYARATRHSKRGERVADLGGEEIAEETIEGLVVRARGQLLACLERASLSGGALDFADEVVARGLVRKALAADGEEVWVPIDASRLRLRDRVGALFVADALNDAAAYEELFVCHRCEAVVFDHIAKRVGVCGAHRISGVVPGPGSAPKVAGE